MLCNNLFSLTPADWIAGSSAIVALCALGATIYQASLSRTHNRLSVRPHLDYYEYTYPDKPVALLIANKGLGPALVERFSIYFDGVEHPVENGVPAELQGILATAGLRANFLVFTPGTPISAGGEIDLLSFVNSTASPNHHNTAVHLLRRFGFQVEYQSMYREKCDSLKLFRSS